MLVKTRHAVEVEEHAASIFVHEHGLGGAGSGSNLDLTGLGARRNHHVKRITVSGSHLDGIGAGELDGKRSEEVGTADGHLVAGFGPFAGHSLNLGNRRQHLEVIEDDGAVTGNQMHFVILHGGQGLGNLDHQGLGRHETGIQDSRLVVEIDIVNTGEIVTHDADGLFHGGLCDDHVFVGIADKVDGGHTGSLLEAVRIVQGLAGGYEGQTHEYTNIFSHCFHGFKD